MNTKDSNSWEIPGTGDKGQPNAIKQHWYYIKLFSISLEGMQIKLLTCYVVEFPSH